MASTALITLLAQLTCNEEFEMWPLSSKYDATQIHYNIHGLTKVHLFGLLFELGLIKKFPDKSSGQISAVKNFEALHTSVDQDVVIYRVDVKRIGIAWIRTYFISTVKVVQGRLGKNCTANRVPELDMSLLEKLAKKYRNEMSRLKKTIRRVSCNEQCRLWM